MADDKKNETPKWILIITGLLTLVAAIFLVVTRYHESRKAIVEADRAQNEAKATTPQPSLESMPTKTEPPKTVQLPPKPLTRVVDIQADPPFDKYLRANPILLEVSGFKVIRLKNGKKVILSVANTEIKDDSARERIRAEKVCLIKATVNNLKEMRGIHVTSEATLADGGTTVNVALAEVVEVATAKVEGLVKQMPPVGRWTSPDGKVVFLATGRVVNAKGEPDDSEE